MLQFNAYAQEIIMTAIARWSYTQPCTIWLLTGKDKYGKPTFDAPVSIMCDYGFDKNNSTDAKGNEIVQKNTFWTEYQEAKIGDYIMIGTITNPDPLAAGANQILNVKNYGSTFDRSDLPDFALIT